MRARIAVALFAFAKYQVHARFENALPVSLREAKSSLEGGW